MHINFSKASWLRFKIAILLSASVLAVSCDREEDDLIPQPTETSTIISGHIETPEGKPLSGISVSVDFKVTGLFGASVIHKAKGTTDKSGFYKIFFDASNEIGQGMHSGYVFSVDFSSLSQDDYIISEKLDYGFTAIKGEWSGSTIKCDFTIPHKKLVNVTVANSGISILNGEYAVKNEFHYLTVTGYLLDVKNPWNDVAIWHIYESVEMPMNGTISVTMPCALNGKNSLRLVYHGDESIGYPNGIPASEAKTVEVTDKFNDTIELNYRTPDPANRWDN
ncbi:MAG: hypothetical protein K2H88_06345 [Duncaniella sp.]|nr:hypothetical protein [Duncaniella sp.]